MALDFTKPVQTRSGLKVTILTAEARGNWPVIGLIHEPAKDTGCVWTLKGAFRADEPSEFDLEQVPERVTTYYPVFDGGRLCGGVIRGAQLALGYPSVVAAVRDFPGTQRLIECVWEDDQLCSTRVVGVDGEEI